MKNITHLMVGAIATNCWIYPINDNDVAVIDPGEEAGTIISTLESKKLTPKLILLTHGHFDHIAALSPLVKAYEFVNPQVAIHRADGEYLGPDAFHNAHSVSIKAALGSISSIDALWPQEHRDLPHAGRLLEDGDTIGPFTVIHLPGHTPGSAAFWDKEEDILFSGDTLFAGDYGRTDLPGGDQEQLFASLRRLLAMDGKIRVYPGHGPVTTIDENLDLL